MTISKLLQFVAKPFLVTAVQNY